MKNRDFLIFIAGYVRRLTIEKKTIKSAEINHLIHLISQRQEIYERLNKSSKLDVTNQDYNYNVRISQQPDSMMSGYDDDRDPDQQDESFW